MTPKFKLLLISLSAILVFQVRAQTPSGSGKKEQLKALLDAKTYQFHALSATSMKGKTVQLTSDYYLKVNKDSLKVDLPYYGRSYSADYGSNDLSVHFTTTQFSYVSDTTKKGGWEITIVPKNQSKASKIYLSVTSSGYCNVSISSSSRQPISYYGTIRALPVK